MLYSYHRTFTELTGIGIVGEAQSNCFLRALTLSVLGRSKLLQQCWRLGPQLWRLCCLVALNQDHCGCLLTLTLTMPQSKVDFKNIWTIPLNHSTKDTRVEILPPAAWQKCCTSSTSTSPAPSAISPHQSSVFSNRFFTVHLTGTLFPPSRGWSKSAAVRSVCCSYIRCGVSF